MQRPIVDALSILTGVSRLTANIATGQAIYEEWLAQLIEAATEPVSALFLTHRLSLVTLD
jgi:hypothetical protein